MIYNEYYRDQNLIDEVPLTNESILHRSWEKDYFTSALPWQQRGIAPALPVDVSIGGTSNAVWQNSAFGYNVNAVANVFVTDAELGTKVESYIPGFAKTLNKNTIDGTLS